MKHDNSKNIIDAGEIIGEYYYEKTLQFQAKSGSQINCRSKVSTSTDQVKKRLVTSINFLNSKEIKTLLELENLFNN